MTQPAPYEREYSFTGYQSGHPRTPLPGDKVDGELDAVAAVLDQVLARIAIIQRDDLALANNSVGYDQLSDEVVLGFDPPSAWLTATDYTVRSTVFNGQGFYRCLVSHTSSVFATDLSSGYWELLADLSPSVVGKMDSSIYDPQGKATDAFARANHTGTQLAATISDFSTAADLRIAAALAGYQPLDADLTSWAAVTRATGFDAFAATPSSANLRTLLNDEAGTGAAYFVGGALGTPASGVATNLTGLPFAGLLAAAVATSAEYRTGTAASKLLTIDQVNNAMAEVTLTDAATIVWDMATGIDFTVTLAGNRTLGNPSNCVVGRRGRIRVVQDGTGSRTLTKSSNHKTAAGAALSMSTTAGAIDYIDYDCRSATDIRLSLSKAWA